MHETILLVEDSPDSIAILSHCLGTAGLEVTVAENGRLALDQVAQIKPDLILLDVMMPGMDGFETCRQLKGRPDTRNIPVLFISALAARPERLRGFAVGGVDYITKPFDMSEVLARVQTHLTLRRQQIELETLLAQRNKFMRTAAHDLRNPLLGVLAYAELGKADAAAEGAERMGRYFGHIFEAACRMKDIVDVFLALQVQSHKRLPAVFDLCDVVEHVLALNRLAAEAKGIVLSNGLPAKSLVAFGDFPFTHQIITNYVSNAIKFGPSGSTVQLSAVKIGDRVRLAVKDQGPGVPVAERDKLFVEFAQIAVKATTGESSVGLGLSTVKYLAEIQGGKAGADFPPEGGSVFWFELPLGKA